MLLFAAVALAELLLAMLLQHVRLPSSGAISGALAAFGKLVPSIEYFASHAAVPQNTAFFLTIGILTVPLKTYAVWLFYDAMGLDDAVKLRRPDGSTRYSAVLFVTLLCALLAWLTLSYGYDIDDSSGQKLAMTERKYAMILAGGASMWFAWSLFATVGLPFMFAILVRTWGAVLRPVRGG